MYNFENSEDVIRYLADTPYASDKIALLSGGYTNYVYRLYLRNSHKGEQTLVFKHAKSFSVGEVLIHAKRLILEFKALSFTHEWLPADSTVRIPKAHFLDEKEFVIIMSDCDDGLVPLKEYVRENALSVQLGREIGVALGKFAARLHIHHDEAVLETLEEDSFARDLAAWATHGRVRDTLTGKDTQLSALPRGLVPPPAEDIEAASAAAEELAVVIRAPGHQTIMHGDFWPGNVLVDVRNGRLHKLHLVDWEICRPGLPGIELGQMCAEMYLLARFVDGREESVGAMVEAMWEAYVSVNNQVDEEVRRQLLRHAGAHFICWPPRVLPAWGTEDQLQKLVLEGVSLMSGKTPNAHWLEKHIPSV